MRTFVEFDATFPDDSQWDANDNLITPGGRALIEWLRESLQASGFECHVVVQKSFYGWQFQVVAGGTISQCVLQHGSLWLLICEPEVPPLRHLIQGSNSDSQQSLLFAINAILKQDSRVTHLQWFSRKEYGESRESRESRDRHP
jgi:hypothetical protein